MSEPAQSEEAGPESRLHTGRLPALALGALGIVFGDIGTSPLYTLQLVTTEHAVVPSEDNILGVLSLIFWGLTLVVAIKYLTFVMRADNRGEGGILALLALIPQRTKKGIGAVSRPGSRARNADRSLSHRSRLGH